MTDLTQQLEDKKKILIELEKNGMLKQGYACGEDFEYWDFPCDNQKEFHRVLEAEIAILEQAIAEMQKQRQEILDKIQEVKEILINKGFDHQHTEDCFICECIDKLEQLNQPKTENGVENTKRVTTDSMTTDRKV